MTDNDMRLLRLLARDSEPKDDADLTEACPDWPDIKRMILAVQAMEESAKATKR